MYFVLEMKGCPMKPLLAANRHPGFASSLCFFFCIFILLSFIWKNFQPC